MDPEQLLVQALRALHKAGRPIRLYKHTFERDTVKLVFVRSGATPCRAKAAAFLALEQKLQQDQLPRTGWQLTAQVDVTHLATV
jgi:hypothetical protein